MIITELILCQEGLRTDDLFRCLAGTINDSGRHAAISDVILLRGDVTKVDETEHSFIVVVAYRLD